MGILSTVMYGKWRACIRRGGFTICDGWYEFENDGIDKDNWGEVELNNDGPIIMDPINETPYGGCLPCLSSGAGKGETPPKVGGRHWSLREHLLGGKLEMVSNSKSDKR